MSKSIVIPLGKNSRMGNLELRYALRSIEKHVRGVKNIIIVGEKPAFLSENIIHIPVKDYARKQDNIRRKIEAAIADERCTETLLFTNDDIFFTENVSIHQFPAYYSGELEKVREKGARQTEAKLKALNKPVKQFDIHTPILYKKEKFKKAMAAFDWANEDYIIKSSYANFHEIEGEPLADLKINSHLPDSRIMEVIKDRPCFSIGDAIDWHAMQRVLDTLYPLPSKYELINQQKAA